MLSHSVTFLQEGSGKSPDLNASSTKWKRKAGDGNWESDSEGTWIRAFIIPRSVHGRRHVVHRRPRRFTRPSTTMDRRMHIMRHSHVRRHMQVLKNHPRGNDSMSRPIRTQLGKGRIAL